jgi:hypothetical protein
LAEVILVPPEKNPSRCFMLAMRDVYGADFGGWAKPDGSCTEGDPFQVAGAITFATAEEAIHWATARHWRVANEMMFGKRANVPPRMTVLVTSADYAPWYVLHETLKSRVESGEQVRQVEIKFKPLDVFTEMGGGYVIVDSTSLGILKAGGIRSPQEMAGRILLLESEDTSDLVRPLRIVRVIRD